MKRGGPLKRKTPLRATRAPRTARSTALRTNRRPAFDPAERAAVMARDRVCIARVLWRLHLVDEEPDECRNQWGDAQTYAEPLTLGHTRTDPGGARRDDRRFCVAECHWHNLQHWESKEAAAVNAYLDRIYPDRRTA